MHPSLAADSCWELPASALEAEWWWWWWLIVTCPAIVTCPPCMFMCGWCTLMPCAVGGVGGMLFGEGLPSVFTESQVGVLAAKSFLIRLMILVIFFPFSAQ